MKKENDKYKKSSHISAGFFTETIFNTEFYYVPYILQFLERALCKYSEEEKLIFHF